MNRPMTKQEWFEYLDKTWDAAQEEARAEQQEPVAWLPPDPPPECSTDAEKTAFAFGWFKALEAQRLSSSSPKREWQGLTDDEVSKLIDNEIGFNSCCGWEEEYTRAVEAKLKEKNT